MRPMLIPAVPASEGPTAITWPVANEAGGTALRRDVKRMIRRFEAGGYVFAGTVQVSPTMASVAFLRGDLAEQEGDQ
jgi:hypothetical protein